MLSRIRRVLGKAWDTLFVLWSFSVLTVRGALLGPFFSFRDLFDSCSLLIAKSIRYKIGMFGKERDCVKDFKGLILTSHKGFCDFCAQIVFDFPAIISRWMVSVFIPGAVIGAYFGGNLLFFKRSDKKRNDQITGPSKNVIQLSNDIEFWLKYRNDRVVTFPEGHRLYKRGLQPLRTGIFRIAYEKKIKVLIAPAEGGQNVIQEQDYLLHPDDICLKDKGENIENQVKYVGSMRHEWQNLRGVVIFNLCAIVDPNDYDSWQSFYDVVCELFTQGYEKACQVYDQVTEGTSAAKLG